MIELDLTSLKKFCDGELAFSEFHPTDLPSMPKNDQSALSKAFVAIAILLYWKDSHGNPLAEEDGRLRYSLEKLIRSIFDPQSGYTIYSSICATIRTTSLREREGRVTRLTPPREISELLASYDGVPPGVQAFIEERGTFTTVHPPLF